MNKKDKIEKFKRLRITLFYMYFYKDKRPAIANVYELKIYQLINANSCKLLDKVTALIKANAINFNDIFNHADDNKLQILAKYVIKTLKLYDNNKIVYTLKKFKDNTIGYTTAIK